MKTTAPLLLLTLAGCTTEVPPQPTASSETTGTHKPPPSKGPGTPSSHAGFIAEVDFQLQGEVAGTPRDIVVISLDTVRADRLSVYGGPAATPQLEALARRGTRFNQAISHFPETALSHWAMLSGVAPEVHGNVPAHGGSLYPGPTLAELARHSGYHTAAVIGGSTLTDFASGLSRGFQLYDDEVPVSGDDMCRPAPEVTAAALAWWEATPSPRLLFVHYFDAHFPYTPEAPWDTAYDPDYTGTLTGSEADLGPIRAGETEVSERDLEHVLALYDGELSQLDADLAPLLAVLDGDTIVSVTSDHGESFEHDYYFNHRAGLWDGITRVPWILAGPGVPEAAEVPAQVGLIDVTPTLLALAGLPFDVRMQGASRVDLLQGKGLGRDVVISLTDPWAEAPQRASRTVTHKLIAWEDRHEAYDLVADPEELRPLAKYPKALDDALKDHALLIDKTKAMQVEPPPERSLSPERAAELEALGYLSGSSGAPGEGAGTTDQGGVRGSPPAGKSGKKPGLPPGTPPPVHLKDN